MSVLHQFCVFGAWGYGTFFICAKLRFLTADLYFSVELAAILMLILPQS